jgi:hypothetical protein
MSKLGQQYKTLHFTNKEISLYNKCFILLTVQRKYSTRKFSTPIGPSILAFNLGLGEPFKYVVNPNLHNWPPTLICTNFKKLQTRVQNKDKLNIKSNTFKIWPNNDQSSIYASF